MEGGWKVKFRFTAKVCEGDLRGLPDLHAYLHMFDLSGTGLHTCMKAAPAYLYT